MPQKNAEKVVFIVLDGWGLNKKYAGNAVELAHKPFFDKLWQRYPIATLETSGETVGLPEGQMGTSEVNHFTIGAGKVVFQDLVRVNKAIDDSTFFKNEAFLNSCNHVKKHNSTLHIFGLVSDGGVHSHIEHIKALVTMAKKQGVSSLYIHAFTDGRDTAPKSGLKFLHELEDHLRTTGLGKIVSVVGRYYAMDRDKNWDRTNMAFNLITQAEGEVFSSVEKAIQASYNNEITDEFIKPCTVAPDTGESYVVRDTDAIIFANFRNDRPRQLTEVFLKHGFKDLQFTTMTQYNPFYDVSVAFEQQKVDQCVGSVISDAKLKQLRVTETEKFAHMTFFLNCKKEDAYEGEDRVMFDSSSDIPTHDYRPEMRAADIAHEIVKNIELEKYDAIFSNLCNADMIGHTGNIPAAVKGCEAVDLALAQIVPNALKHGYTVIITADHGNAEEMLDEETGDMITCHSTNSVPFILVSEKYKTILRKSGTLVDMAPTIFKILDLEKPEHMTGESFI
ncbi:2,3-bisphosphoglycerate-independent phosphoglycerate mutase [Candidatus Woesebacteria bacterium]|nr:2,3-bisphosphoglycerate-independent phosphoglycerate mutase [Candidatus Woesebacteria bacterium]